METNVKVVCSTVYTGDCQWGQNYSARYTLNHPNKGCLVEYCPPPTTTDVRGDKGSGADKGTTTTAVLAAGSGENSASSTASAR